MNKLDPLLGGGWRNVFWLTQSIEWDGEVLGPGKFVSHFVWPSKDVAESVAFENRDRWSALGALYLGCRKYETHASSKR